MLYFQDSEGDSNLELAKWFQEAMFISSIDHKIKQCGNPITTTYNSMTDRRFQLDFLQFVENLFYLRNMTRLYGHK